MNRPNESEWIERLIHRRQSVKPADFDPQCSIDRSLIEWLLRLAQRAPTHGMTEPWRFAVFTGPALESLGRRLQELYRSATPPPHQKEEKLAKLATTVAMSSAVIVIGARWDPRGNIPRTEEIAATACAVQNLHLAATAAGLAGYWSSPACLYHDQGPGVLELSEQMDALLGLFYLGWPRPDLSRPTTPRSSLEEQVSWHSNP